MKILVATDIHGSLAWAERVIQKFEEEKADKLVLLGDLYYHGPRNPLPEKYAPMEVAALFNKFKDKIIAVRGNCDADIDQTISEFKIKKHATITINGRKIYFTHGDKYNKNNVPEVLKKGDVMIFGHWHINDTACEKGVECINIASLSLPKDESKPSYAVIDKRGLSVNNFDGKTVFYYSF